VIVQETRDRVHYVENVGEKYFCWESVLSVQWDSEYDGMDDQVVEHAMVISDRFEHEHRHHVDEGQ
jgi:hypothetical protein